MKAEGSSGRGAVLRNDEQVLNGVLSDDVRPAGRRKRRCDNPRCGRLFSSRQEGDDYCTSACEFSDNPSYSGKRRQN